MELDLLLKMILSNALYMAPKSHLDFCIFPVQLKEDYCVCQHIKKKTLKFFFELFI